MKKQFFTLAFALSAAACGSSDKPAQDPSTVTTTGATSSLSETKPASDPAANTTWSTTTPEASKPAPNAVKPTTNNAANDTAATNNATNNGPAPSVPPPPDPAANKNPGVADQTKNADNTKINDRDRHGTVTPMDQGNSDSELKITAAIRKGVVGDKSLGFNAKNIKIITTGSKVTLRGPVSSDQERSNIEARAKATPGVTEVDNQIEVKK